MTKESIIKENTYNLEMCRKHDCNYILIDDVYEVEFTVRGIKMKTDLLTIPNVGRRTKEAMMNIGITCV